MTSKAKNHQISISDSTPFTTSLANSSNFVNNIETVTKNSTNNHYNIFLNKDLLTQSKEMDVSIRFNQTSVKSDSVVNAPPILEQKRIIDTKVCSQTATVTPNPEIVNELTFLHNYSKVPDNDSNNNARNNFMETDEEEEDDDFMDDNNNSSKNDNFPAAARMDAEEKTPDHHARRPMNAFLIFCKRHRTMVREKYPNLENR